jgi:hypothetical protein
VTWITIQIRAILSLLIRENVIYALMLQSQFAAFALELVGTDIYTLPSERPGLAAGPDEPFQHLSSPVSAMGVYGAGG